MSLASRSGRRSGAAGRVAADALRAAENGPFPCAELEFYVSGRFMELGSQCPRNLELTETMRAGKSAAASLWVLDHTKTAMGSRMLRSWLESRCSARSASTRASTPWRS